MSDDIPDSPTVLAAQAFQRMHDRIMHNKDEPFGGAFVITPPGEEPVVLQAVFLNASADASAVFWGAVKTMVDTQLGIVESVERQMTGGQRRR